MVDPVAEQLIREKAAFFAKGKMPDLLRTSIPNSSFKKGMTYILALIEVDEFETEYIDDSEGAVNLNKLTPIEDRYANYITHTIPYPGPITATELDATAMSHMTIEAYKKWRAQYP